MSELAKLVRIRCLVIGSGGTNGVYYAGALRHLQEVGWLDRVTHYYGTSIGALMATMLALGYAPAQISKLATRFDFSMFIAPSLVNAFENSSIMVVERWIEFLRYVVHHAGYDPETTLAQLHAQTGKTLGIVGYDITAHEEALFTHATAPDMPVWKAVQISSAIPLFTCPVQHGDRLYVDGALSNPTPMRYSPYGPDETLGIDLHTSLPEGERVMPHTYVTILFNRMKRAAEGPGSGNLVRFQVAGEEEHVNFFRSEEERARLEAFGYQECKRQVPGIVNNIIANNIKNREQQHVNPYL